MYFLINKFFKLEILDISDGVSVTWYEPSPEETLSSHTLDHKLKTVKLQEGVTEFPLSWNFSLSSDLTFNSLTVLFSGVAVGGVLSSGQAGLVNPSDQRYSFSWIPTEKFTLVILNVTDGDSGMFTCALSLCQGFQGCNSWESTIKVEVVGKFTRDKKNKYRNKYWVEVSLQMYYATEVNSLTTYLLSQYGYPNERNFKLKGAGEEKIARVQCR